MVSSRALLLLVVLLFAVGCAGRTALPVEQERPAVRAIEGRVLRPDGKPVPFVRIGAWRPGPDDPYARPLASAKTGEDGRFVLADLSWTPLVVRAWAVKPTCHGGFEMREWTTEVAVDGSTESLDIATPTP